MQGENSTHIIVDMDLNREDSYVVVAVVFHLNYDCHSLLLTWYWNWFALVFYSMLRWCVQALALGAKAVFLGRPVLWGLAHSGVKGIVVWVTQSCVVFFCVKLYLMCLYEIYDVILIGFFMMLKWYRIWWDVILFFDLFCSQEAGVDRVLTLLNEELLLAMQLAGVVNLQVSINGSNLMFISRLYRSCYYS